MSLTPPPSTSNSTNLSALPSEVLQLILADIIPTLISIPLCPCFPENTSSPPPSPPSSSSPSASSSPFTTRPCSGTHITGRLCPFVVSDSFHADLARIYRTLQAPAMGLSCRRLRQEATRAMHARASQRDLKLLVCNRQCISAYLHHAAIHRPGLLARVAYVQVAFYVHVGAARDYKRRARRKAADARDGVGQWWETVEDVVEEEEEEGEEGVVEEEDEGVSEEGQGPRLRPRLRQFPVYAECWRVEGVKRWDEAQLRLMERHYRVCNGGIGWD